ncbi:DISARM system phospholipase D-like protein DrmC [Acaryochloris marina NIES-2412]|uniref:DISARM system phospholipase D-like protein DrmC n=1 Tax=Acaryochloris marina TaxID=155978 RepID=UPI0040583F20
MVKANSVFHRLSRPALTGLASALASDRIQLPCQPGALAHIVPTSLLSALTSEINRLSQEGMKGQHLAYMLQLLAQERKSAQAQRNAIDLVWTGQEVLGTESRDTRVVVQELFRSAKDNILISSYAFDKGDKAKALFQPLVERMAALPDLKVRLFLNIKRPYSDRQTSEATLLRKFAESFRHDIWPGDRLPEVFYEPQSLSKSKGARTCLHAKCVVVDDERVFVTSANFTEAAHERNIEAGVLLSDVISAKSMRAQFETLVSRDLLRRVPGL